MKVYKKEKAAYDAMGKERAKAEAPEKETMNAHACVRVKEPLNKVHLLHLLHLESNLLFCKI
jgi:hypothetical protein